MCSNHFPLCPGETSVGISLANSNCYLGRVPSSHTFVTSPLRPPFSIVPSLLLLMLLTRSASAEVVYIAKYLSAFVDSFNEEAPSSSSQSDSSSEGQLPQLHLATAARASCPYHSIGVQLFPLGTKIGRGF